MTLLVGAEVIPGWHPSDRTSSHEEDWVDFAFDQIGLYRGYWTGAATGSELALGLGLRWNGLSDQKVWLQRACYVSGGIVVAHP